MHGKNSHNKSSHPKSSRKSPSHHNQKSDKGPSASKTSKQKTFSGKAPLTKSKTLVDYIKSAVFPEDYPETSLPEIAFAGRSNAGKSSLINRISQSQIAHVSQTPGKTRLLSFFNVRQKYILVDMPGYGFSKRSGDEQSSWEKMVETYIEKREQLCGLILVMDVRRDWTMDEELLKVYLERSGIPLAIALTKTDKLSKNEIMARSRSLEKQTGISAIFPISSLKGTGIEDIEDYLYKKWVDERT